MGWNIEANFEKDEKIKEAFEDSETWSECSSLQLKAALIVALKKEKPLTIRFWALSSKSSRFDRRHFIKHPHYN